MNPAASSSRATVEKVGSASPFSIRAIVDCSTQARAASARCERPRCNRAVLISSAVEVILIRDATTALRTGEPIVYDDE